MKASATEVPALPAQTPGQEDVEGLKIQKEAMRQKNAELAREIDGLKLDVEELKLNAENDKRKLELLKNECEDWRRKYKEEVKVGVSDGSEAQKKQERVINTEMSVVEDKETIESLRRELEYMKSKNEQMVRMMQKSGGAESVRTPEPALIPAREADVNSSDLLTKNVKMGGVWDA